MLTSKQRLLTAIQGGTPDRLPATTHHVMSYFLDQYMGGMGVQDFFEQFGLDPIRWEIIFKPAPDTGAYADPLQGPLGFLEPIRVVSDEWRISFEELPSYEYKTTRYHFITPGGTMSMETQGNSQTTWVTEYLVKEKKDIELIAKYMTTPLCDVEAANRAVEEFGEQGLVRSHIPCFDVFGQPGTWQDACCLVGTERLIFETYDDPGWVHELLQILLHRKIKYLESMIGARYDILELGGGSASSTVISPKLFDQFVAPYDSQLIELAHQVGQRIVYHTCGGMMPILERVADMGPDAMETFTPSGMGGDADLVKAKQRIGDKVCMIGGFDQFHYLTNCTPQETKAEVRRCFEAAGGAGGYILCPSDHFFDADPKLIQAYAEEAKRCMY